MSPPAAKSWWTVAVPLEAVLPSPKSHVKSVIELSGSTDALASKSHESPTHEELKSATGER
ncbi:MAG: hypothetical protein R2734_14525 [Nocardioides sp.]